MTTPKCRESISLRALLVALSLLVFLSAAVVIFILCDAVVTQA
jgi:hypothetical protein